jgi:hypothetical protein
MAVGLCIVQFLVIIPLTLRELRRVVRIYADAEGREQGVLIGLGVGRELISEETLKKIENAKVASHPHLGSIKMWVTWYIPMTIFFGVLAYFGKGMQSNPWLNRASYFLVYQFTTFTIGVLATMKIALQTGMSIAETKVVSISRELQKELEPTVTHISDAEWKESVTQPCQQLIDIMELLSHSFALGLILDLLYKISSFTLCVCLLMSPSRQDIGNRVGEEWIEPISVVFLVIWMLGSMASSFVAVYGPASVSTAW